MFLRSVIILVITTECSSIRRQFNHYQEFLQKQALRAKDITLPPSRQKVKRFEGPPRSPTYSPTYGYEPYWYTGDWVYERNKVADADQDEDCGTTCFKIYEKYGPICGQDYKGTSRNFSSICEMKSLDCRGRQGWLIANRGICRPTHITNQHNPANIDMAYTESQMKAAQSIIQSFSSRFPGVGDDREWV